MTTFAKLHENWDVQGITLNHLSEKLSALHLHLSIYLLLFLHAYVHSQTYILWIYALNVFFDCFQIAERMRPIIWTVEDEFHFPSRRRPTSSFVTPTWATWIEWWWKSWKRNGLLCAISRKSFRYDLIAFSFSPLNHIHESSSMQPCDTCSQLHSNWYICSTLKWSCTLQTINQLGVTIL